MKLKSLHLVNIACFEDTVIDFCLEGTEKPATCVVLLGENGTGKTTVLQMAAAALLSLGDIYQVAGNQGWGLYLRDSHQPGKATAYFRLDPEDTRRSPHFSSVTIHQSGFLSASNPIPDGKKPGWLACGYSCGRRLSRYSPPASEPEIGAPPYRFATLFGNESGLTQAEEWIANLYARKTHPDHTPADEKRFVLVVETLEKVLPGATFHKVTVDRRVLFRVGEKDVPLERLSDGYRSTTAWVLDLLRRLLDTFPQSDNPLEASGVVLVDEIDLHLHPRWQRTVIETVRKTFPHLQFIVTTHSPFIAQDMTERDKLIVLRSGADGSVYAESGMGFAQRWRADQILTSWLFDLESTRGEEAQQDEARYRHLLKKRLAGELSEEQGAQLRALKQQLDNDPLGETISDQELLDAADAILTGFRQR